MSRRATSSLIITLLGVSILGGAALPGISSARAAQLPHATALLSALIAELGVASVVVSHTGLREGLLLQRSRDFST